MQKLFYGKNKTIHKIVKEKEIPTSFTVSPQTTKVLTTVYSKSLVKMGKTSVYVRM
jgi:hypothetical protein